MVSSCKKGSVAEIVVRVANLADAQEVGTLTEQAYLDTAVADKAYRAVLRDGGRRIDEATVLVAAVDGHVAGTVTLATHGTEFGEICHDDELEVRMLATADHARRRGIADQLMAAAEAHARSLRLAGVILSTEPRMLGAHRLYERRGYRRAPERDWTIDGIDLLVYRLTLAR